MSQCIAERVLHYCLKGSNEHHQCVLRILAPEEILPGEVTFPFTTGTARCIVQLCGLPETISEEFIGADTVQALQLATEVEPLLKRMSVKYDFFFPSGEGYFGE